MGFCSKNLLISMAIDEATDADCENLETIIGGVNIEDVIGKMDKIFNSDVKLTLEAVNVHNCKRLGKFLVESNDIAKYMMDNSVHTFIEAIKNIAEQYKLDPKNVAIAVDEDAIRNIVDEAKIAAKTDDKAFKEAKLKDLEALQKAFSIMEEQGVQVVRLTEDETE